MDHLLFEGRRHGDEPEGRVRDNDRIPCSGRCPAQEARPLVLAKIGFVRHEDAGIGVECEKLTGRLRQAMAGDDQHRLGDQPEPALFYHRCGHRHRLAGADCVGKVGRTGRNNSPDTAFLVPIKRKGA
ncbi:hypothetical protein FQZ97_871570 [compost metagenome]